MSRPIAILFFVLIPAAAASAQPVVGDGIYRAPAPEWWTRGDTYYHSRNYTFPPDERVYFDPQTGVYQFRSRIFGNALGPWYQSLGPFYSYLGGYGPYGAALGPYGHLGPMIEVYPYYRSPPSPLYIDRYIDRWVDLRWQPSPELSSYPPRP